LSLTHLQRTVGRGIRLFFLSCLMGGPSSALAQAPPAPVQFEVRRFEVEGAWLLAADRIDEVLAPFAGPGRTVADLQQARAALEAAYAKRGYGATQVILPEQELKGGVVRLRVVEAQLSRVLIEGNRFFGYTNIRQSLPALQTGAPVNTAELAGNLQLANENPAKQTVVVLKPGVRADEVEAEVRVADQRPYRFSLSLDNTGTPDTGYYRLGAGFQHANVFDRDEVLNLQYLTSPDRTDDVLIVGAGYHIPLYARGDSIDLVAGYANVDSGVVQNLFNISGSGQVYAARYNFGLPRVAGIEQRLALGFDWLAYDNNVVPIDTTTTVVPDYTLHPLGLAYTATWRGAADEVAFYLGGQRNIPGGSQGDQARFDLVRPGANADYTLSRLNLVWVHSFPRDVQGRVRFTGQYTSDELLPAAQFGIGGMDSVRGFNERQFIGDRGYSGTVEVYSPDFGDRFEVNGVRARLLAFYDYGRVWTINPEVFEPRTTGISSAGPGIRIGYKSNLSLRLDYGFVINNGGSADSGRTNFSLVWVF
jgi:hemolysin activation/secretion protein